MRELVDHGAELSVKRISQHRREDLDPVTSPNSGWPLVGVHDARLVLGLQRVVGNRAVTSFVADGRQVAARHTVQRNGEQDEETGSERSRRSRPRNAPPGTRPIDQSGLDRETIHKIKDAIGAGPKDWVGVTPDGEIITTGEGGNAQPEGHVTDFSRKQLPDWVWAALGVAAAIALIVLFATGVGEVGTILAGASAAVRAIVMAVLAAA